MNPVVSMGLKSVKVSMLLSSALYSFSVSENRPSVESQRSRWARPKTRKKLA